MDAVETLFPIQPSLDSIDSLSKNSGIFCVFETFVLFSDTHLIPVKISFTFFFLRNKAIGRDINKYFKRSFSPFRNSFRKFRNSRTHLF